MGPLCAKLFPSGWPARIAVQGDSGARVCSEAAKRAPHSPPPTPRAPQHLGSRYLDVPVQKLLGESLQGHGGILRAVGLPVEGWDVGGVTGEGLGVEVLEGFEVVVDGVSHHDLPREDLQNLKQEQRMWG